MSTTCKLAAFIISGNTVPSTNPTGLASVTCCDPVACCPTTGDLTNFGDCCSTVPSGSIKVWWTVTSGTFGITGTVAAANAIGVIKVTGASITGSGAGTGTPTSTCTTCANTGYYAKASSAVTEGGSIPIGEGATFTCCSNMCCSDNTATCCNTPTTSNNLVFVKNAAYNSGTNAAQPGTGTGASKTSNPTPNCFQCTGPALSSANVPATLTPVAISTLKCCDSMHASCCAMLGSGSFVDGYTPVTSTSLMPDFTMLQVKMAANTCPAPTPSPPPPSPPAAPVPVLPPTTNTDTVLPATLTAVLAVIAFVVLFIGLPSFGAAGLGRKKRSLVKAQDRDEHLNETTAVIKRLIEAAKEIYGNEAERSEAVVVG